MEGREGLKIEKGRKGGVKGRKENQSNKGQY